jgi:UPF0755 protein
MGSMRRVTILAVGLGLVGLGAWGTIFSSAGRRSAEAVLFTVAEGESLRSVARDLESEGLIRSTWTFRVWARLKGQERSVRSGEYELSPGQSVASMLEALVAGPLLTHAVTLPEGWTLQQTNARLAAELDLDPATLDSLCHRPLEDWRARLGLAPGLPLEGYLLPETYRFARGVSERSVLATLVGAFADAFVDSMHVRAAEIGMSVHEVVTLASIVEAEAVLDRERPSVAAVYLNRIRKGWKLEADPTVAYALGKQGQRLTFRDLEVDSAYNTYRYAGLPPGPINSPGIASLRAVLWPEPEFDAMYFVADGEGGHRFSRTWEEHQAAVREYRAIQRERRGGGG